jgi:glycerate kinase
VKPAATPRKPRAKGRRLRVLLAPCGFKEGLTVAELMRDMARGVEAAAPDAEILRAPMFDGGEGFTETLVQLTGGSLHPVRVTGPLGCPVDAQVGLLGGVHRGEAVIEIAAAAGLRHVPLDARDLSKTTSYGVGELILAAADLGARRLLVGCGDSGVNDGGAGLAEALGIHLLNGRNRPIGRGGGALARLRRIDMSGRDSRVAGLNISVAVNCRNRLLGPKGVTRVFGPQKGASGAMVSALECGLENLAAKIQRDLGIDVRTMSGAGASGGIGAGLHAFAGARLNPRFKVLSRFLRFDELLDRADLILTAEGCIDWLTPFGKLPAEVARRAKRRGIPVIAIVGSVGEGAAANLAVGVSAYISILNRPMSLAEALAQAPDLVVEATGQAVRLALLDCRPGRRLDHARRGARKYASAI